MGGEEGVSKGRWGRGAGVMGCRERDGVGMGRGVRAAAPWLNASRALMLASWSVT